MPQPQPNDPAVIDSLPAVPLKGFYYPDSVDAYQPKFGQIITEKTGDYRPHEKGEKDTAENISDSLYVSSLWDFSSELRYNGASPVTYEKSSWYPMVFSVLLVLAFISGVITRILSGPRFFRYLQTFFKKQALDEFVDDDYNNWLPPSPWLYITTNFLLLAALVKFVFPAQGIDDPVDFAVALAVSLGLLLLVPIVRAACIRLLGSVFRLDQYSVKHILLSYNTQALSGVILAPLLIVALSWKGLLPGYVLPVLPVVFGLLLCYQFFRLLAGSVRLNLVSLFYNLLYLCTLEIVPLLLIYKTFLQPGTL